MKVYVDELPKNCAECKFCGRLKPPADRPEIECMHCNMAKTFNSISPFCPLESIADHDKKVKDKLLEDVWEIMEKITFDWYEDDDNINSELYIDADDIADILTDFETMSKEEVIEKHKWRFDKSVL